MALSETYGMNGNGGELAMKDLLQSCLKGDHTALQELYLRHRDRCVTHLSKRFDPEDVEDVYQDLFSKIVRDPSLLSVIANDQSNYYLWLFVCLKNLLISKKRKIARYGAPLYINEIYDHDVVGLDIPSPDDRLIHEEDALLDREANAYLSDRIFDFRSALQKLPEQERICSEALMQNIVNGEKLARGKIAAMLHMHHTSFEKALRRALKSLQGDYHAAHNPIFRIFSSTANPPPVTRWSLLENMKDTDLDEKRWDDILRLLSEVKYGDLLRAFHFEGKSYEQIADEQGASRTSICVRLTKARKKLRRLMSEKDSSSS